MRPYRLIIVSLVLGSLAACSTPWGKRGPVSRSPATPPPVATPAPAPESGRGGGRTPKANPHVKLGKPYKVAGIWYTPKAEPGYVKTGIGSWYGPKFHGKLTSNGEVFDMNQVTAAHPTMPLPSIARVTNLQNGREVVVRVNDRGPFAHGRLIDLSRAAAQKLGYRDVGLAKVKVEYLGQASLKRAITRVGAAQAHAGGYYAAVRQDGVPGGQASLDTVRTRIASGPEFKLKTVAVSASGALTRAAIEDGRRAVNEAEKLIVERRIERSAGASSPSSSAGQHATLPPPAPRGAIDAAPMPGISPAPRAPQNASTLPALRADGWLVQAGAFGNRENAQKAIRRLGRIADARASEITGRDGRFLYRVRLGPFRQKQAALDAIEAAAAAGYPGAHLVSP